MLRWFRFLIPERRASSAPERPPEPEVSSPVEGDVPILPIEDSIDLHGFQPRDVPSVVDEYLNEAHRLGFEEVRIPRLRRDESSDERTARPDPKTVRAGVVERERDEPARNAAAAGLRGHERVVVVEHAVVFDPVLEGRFPAVAEGGDEPAPRGLVADFDPHGKRVYRRNSLAGRGISW